MIFFIFGVTFNKIVAVVEKEPISYSYVEKISALYPGFTKADIIKKIVDERIIYYAALKESIEVSESEIEEAFNNNITNIPSLLDLIKGENEQIYKEELKYQLYAKKLIGKKYLDRVSLKREELLKFYEENKDSFYVHPSVKLEKISIEIGKNEKERLYRKCKEIIDEMNSKGFEELVLEYSEDISTKYSGGKLGEFYIYNLPQFFAGIDTLPVGKAGIFFSPDGAHIIRLNSRDKGKVNLSHIFLKFKISKNEISKGLKEANIIRDKWLKGENLQVDTMPEISFALLPYELKDMLSKLEIGDISEPIIEGNTITIVKVISKKEGGIPKFEEIEEHLHMYYFNKKLEKVYNRIVEELKDVFYFKIFE